MEWFAEDWIKRAYRQRAALIELARTRGGQPVLGPNGKQYPPLTGDQARTVLQGWMEILEQSTNAARYVGAERFATALQRFRTAWAAAMLAGDERMTGEELALVFRMTDELARALSEAAHLKREVGDPPTLWEAFLYGLKNPGEIPAAVIEAEKEAANALWRQIKRTGKEAAEALTPEIPLWVKASAAAGGALLVLSTLANLRSSSR